MSRRVEEFADLAEELMAQRAESRLGEIVDVLIEEETDDGRYEGRAAHQAPEVDGVTTVDQPGPGWRPATMVRAVVTGSDGSRPDRVTCGDRRGRAVECGECPHAWCGSSSFLSSSSACWRAERPGGWWRWPRSASASLTDLLDGRLARSRGLVTDFGKIADPVADKALTGAALICLSALGELPWWVTGVIMFREIGVTVLRFWVIRRGVIAASRGGKLKTLLQVIAICLYVLPPALSPPGLVRGLFMAAAVVVTVVTGVDYVLQAVRLQPSRTQRRR